MDKWIATMVGQMHINGITQSELAQELGIRRDYLNKILNGKKSPKNAKEKFEAALENLLNKK